MSAWKSSLIGLGVAIVMIALSLPLTLYIAIDRDNSLKPASAGVFAMWIAMLVIGGVGGCVWPKILGSVDRPDPSDGPD
ncbi:MAG: hypothetical protein ED559_12625 [Phycisphaera sp.]|nr:MAG: hypothetical protein ED559_12625 [Phycisphaera sp.]